MQHEKRNERLWPLQMHFLFFANTRFSFINSHFYYNIHDGIIHRNHHIQGVLFGDTGRKSQNMRL